MNELRYTLVSDGSFDVALLPILDWLLVQNGVDYAIQSNWADLRRLVLPAKTLSEKIRTSMDLYPCEILFIHRDAEREARETRVNEIKNAIREIGNDNPFPYICVVPVRMTEAWLLFDARAIKHAAGNRHGRQRLNLPRLSELEGAANPKQILFELLQRSSRLSGRRLKRFPVRYHASRVSYLISDFSPLRDLSAFRSLESELRTLIRTSGWHN
ncbi:MAG TPA: hypothetical protein VJ044_15760 [Candidatus Hodarchaeales archaeon]|nr:hypothetical protein [Candidatus Hodarchaeales archaeon]